MPRRIIEAQLVGTDPCLSSNTFPYFGKCTLIVITTRVGMGEQESLGQCALNSVGNVIIHLGMDRNDVGLGFLPFSPQPVNVLGKSRLDCYARMFQINISTLQRPSLSRTTTMEHQKGYYGFVLIRYHFIKPYLVRARYPFECLLDVVDRGERRDNADKLKVFMKVIHERLENIDVVFQSLI